MAISDSKAVDVPKGERWTKSKNWGVEKESVLSVQVFFQWRMCVKGRGGDVLQSTLR